MKDKNGKHLKVGDHIVVLEDTASRATGEIESINSFNYPGGKTKLALTVKPHDKKLKLPYPYIPSEVRKLEIEELI